MLQICFVVLRNDAIHESPALVATLADEFAVLRADHDQRNESDMFDEAFVVFLAAAELLLHSAFDTARDDFFFRSVVKDIAPLNHGHVLVVRNILTVNCIVGGFGETEVVDSIQQIGFALTIEPYKTVEFIRETKCRFSDILVVDYADFV